MQAKRLFKKISDGISKLLMAFTLLPFLFWNRLEDIKLPKDFYCTGAECEGYESLWIFLFFAMLSTGTYLFIAHIVEYYEKKADALKTDIEKKSYRLFTQFLEIMGILLLMIYSYMSVFCLLYAFGLIVMEKEVLWGIGFIMAAILTDFVYFAIRIFIIKR